jgi:lipopolysaccharide biosynthesis regulator YciM
MNLLLVVGIGFLLLVVGTLLGRYYTPDRRPLQQAAEEGRSYVRGLVEVLDGNRDGAIDQLVSALQQNSKNVEAYFALGMLFRQRSEHERAVRVHQALLVRRDLDNKTRLRVHRQLALDFHSAGFPRRAIKALEYVVSKDRKSLEAWRELAELYEQTGQWERTAAARRRLGRITGEDTGPLQAHLGAALASEQLDQDQPDAARKSLKRAVAACAGSVHVLHVLARYQQRRGNAGAAAKAWEKALRLAPDLAAYFCARLQSSYAELKKPRQLERLLSDLQRRHPDNIHLRLAHARHEATRDPEGALAALTALLDENPSLLPARKAAARLVLERGEPEEVRRSLSDLLEVLDRADRGYRCGACGRADEDLFWRCPACSAWGSVRVAWGRRAGEGRARR